MYYSVVVVAAPRRHGGHGAHSVRGQGRDRYAERAGGGTTRRDGSSGRVRRGCCRAGEELHLSGLHEPEPRARRSRHGKKQRGEPGDETKRHPRAPRSWTPPAPTSGEHDPYGRPPRLIDIGCARARFSVYRTFFRGRTARGDFCRQPNSGFFEERKGCY